MIFRTLIPFICKFQISFFLAIHCQNINTPPPILYDFKTVLQKSYVFKRFKQFRVNNYYLVSLNLFLSLVRRGTLVVSWGWITVTGGLIAYALLLSWLDHYPLASIVLFDDYHNNDYDYHDNDDDRNYDHCNADTA